MNSNSPFEVLRDYRIGSMYRLELQMNGLFGFLDIKDKLYLPKDQIADCLIILGLLETMTFIMTPSYDLREILNR